jgi:hypothetical protein
VERDYQGRSSIDTNVIISGVEFEPTSDQSDYEDGDDSDTSSTYQEILIRLGGGDTLKEEGQTGFDSRPQNELLASPVLPERGEVLGNPVGLSSNDLLAEEESTGTLAQEGFSISPTPSSILPTVDEELEDEVTAPDVVNLNILHAPLPSTTSSSIFPYSKFITPSQSKSSGISSQKVAELASSSSSTTMRTLSSFPGIYSLGLGTLSRSFTLVGFGGVDVGKRKSSLWRKTRGSKSCEFIEEWILKGNQLDQIEKDDDISVKFHIDVSPGSPRCPNCAHQIYMRQGGLKWRDEGVSFSIPVHSPETTPAMGNNSEFTTYQITTTFDAIPSVTVDRRYSHFASLYALLLARYPIIVVPQLPAKSYIKMQEEAKIDLRRRELEIWCKRVSRHPILKSSEEMKGFLGMEHESVSHVHSSFLMRMEESDYANEVEQDLQDLLKLPNLEVQSTDFFSRVFHPDFNIDCEESRNLIGNFEQYVRNFEGNEVMREIESGSGKLRDSFHGMS